MRLSRALSVFVAVSSLPLSIASAQTLQATLYQSGFSSPVVLCSPPGDLARQFVCEQNTGRIRIIKNGVTLATAFLTLGSGGLNKISSGGERGLLGLAFHPNYASNGFFYVNYTAITSGATVIERYSVSGNPDIASTSGSLPLLTIAQPQSNHNGGCIQFGADGMLYIAMGDGGGANDSGAGHAAGGNAQAGSTLLGKMLRLDVNLPAPYVPASNPYVGVGDPLDEIWHFGLRNPWRFSFDRLTGDMYIGDVGQDAVEEVDFAAAGVGGLNFGWRCMEGASCTGLSGCVCNAANLTNPIHPYNQGASHCAVTGGYVYRGTNLCGVQGTYFFADYCSSAIWSFDYSGGVVSNFTTRTTELEPAGAATINSISAFGEDAAGELYIVDHGDGEIYRIDLSGSSADCNGNSIPDACDIAAGTEQDCDDNTIPDSCDLSAGAPDCNGNFIPDSCDIAGGAADCNSNAVPDTCELAGGAPDCNGNGTLDSCDIAAGSSQDCNANAIPDECDIGSGASLDTNGNGIPDECECIGGVPPFIYCTAKLNSQFCTPAIGFSGQPRVGAAQPFLITASSILNNKQGLLFYSYTALAAPFQGGFKCVGSPTLRTPSQGSGGNPTGNDCSGAFSYDFMARILSGVDPALVPGQQCNTQYWSRDPQDPWTTNLTDAVQFTICN